MKGKKLIMLAMAIALLVAIPVVVFAAGSKGIANENPPTKVKAHFKFHDDGTTLTITGKGNGFEHGESYISLVYGIGSLVEGPEACEPAGSLAGNLMFVGTWNVSAKGKGTLIQAGPASGASLTDIGTISVRRVAMLFSPSPSPGVVTINVLESCGEVK